MAPEAIPTWCIVLVVARRADQFLLVQECEYGQSWHLPAGRVEPGESFLQAALRETREEAGLSPSIEGILRIEHSPLTPAARLRIFYTARVGADAVPKSLPDEHSLGAAWYSLAEMAGLPMRSPALLPFLRAVAAGMPVYPLALLDKEGLV